MVKQPDEPTQLERVRLAIWDHIRPTGDGPSPYPTAREISDATGMPTSSVYKVIEFMEGRDEIKRVKDEKGQFHLVPQGSPLAGRQSEQLIYDNLLSKDPKVSASALEELDQLSQKDRIQSDNLLKYITNRKYVKSARSFCILRRQLILAKKARDRGTSHKLALRKNDAEQSTLERGEPDGNLRDEAFLYLKVINLDAAVKVGLRMIELNERDEALDSTEPTQLWIDVSTTLALAARTQPSIRRQLYSLIEGKTGIAAARAGKILKTAVTQEQDTTLGMFRHVPPNPQLDQA